MGICSVFSSNLDIILEIRLIGYWFLQIILQNISDMSRRINKRHRSGSSMAKQVMIITRVVPDTDLVGYPADNFAGYRISG